MSDRPDWRRLERDVVERIRALEAAFSAPSNIPGDLRERMWNDLAMPALRLLAEFCVCVQLQEWRKDGEP